MEDIKYINFMPNFKPLLFVKNTLLLILFGVEAKYMQHNKEQNTNFMLIKSVDNAINGFKIARKQETGKSQK